MGDFSKQLKAIWAGYAKKDYPLAIKHYEEVISKGKSSPNILYTIAFFHKELKNFDTAIEYCEKALQQDPNHYFTLQVMSEVYAKKGDEEKAYQYILRALPNRPPPLPDQAQGVVKFGKALLKVFGLEDKEDTLRKMWYDSEEIEWCTWAIQFKSEYEKNNNEK